MGVVGNYLHIVKATDTGTRRRRHPQPSKTRDGQGCPLPPLLFSTVLGTLARALRQEKEIKGVQMGEEEYNYLRLQMM